MDKMGFLKKVVIFTLGMGSLVTLAVLAICWRAGEITGSVTAALCTLWSAELAFGTVIRTKSRGNDESI